LINYKDLYLEYYFYTTIITLHYFLKRYEMFGQKFARMSISKSDTAASHHLITESAPSQRYGLVSWSYFFLASLTSLSFFCTQLVVNAVRDKTMLTASLETFFYPDVYWNFVTANIGLLAISGTLLAFTVAVIVVRALLHYQCCKGYFALLGIQTIPWIYFMVSCS